MKLVEQNGPYQTNMFVSGEVPVYIFLFLCFRQVSLAI